MAKSSQNSFRPPLVESSIGPQILYSTHLKGLSKENLNLKVPEIGNIRTSVGCKPTFDSRLMDDTAKGGLTQFLEVFIVIPCAPKDFKRL